MTVHHAADAGSGTAGCAAAGAATCTRAAQAR
jgi:hypothetical protein